MRTYIPNIVQGLRDWYKEQLVAKTKDGCTIHSFFTLMADRLYEAYEFANPVVCNQINNYHPSFIGMSWADLQEVSFTKQDALDTIAYEHGFKGFESISEGGLDIQFENAVDAIVDGRLEDLRSLIKAHPRLAKDTSSWGHNAQLIHYLGNNGVELYRQSVPSNAVAILTCLIENGADLNARMSVYGGQFTLMGLYKTSAHPFETDHRFEFIEALASLGAM